MTGWKNKYQSGAALIMLMLLFIIGIATVYTTIVKPADPALKKHQQTKDALQLAKNSLIGFIAGNYEREPGAFVEFPCADTDTNVGRSQYEGGQDNVCGGTSINIMGRFPWRSLGMEAIKDGNGECLWYVVSGNYTRTNTTASRNHDTNGFLRLFMENDLAVPVYGDTPETRPIALLISPGAAIAEQDRTNDNSGTGVPLCGGNYNVADYLEGIDDINNSTISGVENAIDDFVTSSDYGDSGADIIIPITRKEIFDVINKRYDLVNKWDLLTLSVAQCLQEYSTRNVNNLPDDIRLPYPAPVGFGNKDYWDENNYDDDATFPHTVPGRIPVNTSDSQSTIGNTGGAQNLLADCVANPTIDEEDSELNNLWLDWKDHLFYAVSESRHPLSAAVPVTCNVGNCITVNGDQYSAVVIFSGASQGELVQPRRQMPDTDTPEDDKSLIANFLEGNNSKVRGAVPMTMIYDSTIGAVARPLASKAAPYQLPLSTDIVYCIPAVGGPPHAC